MDCNTPGFPVLHYLLEFVQIYVRCVSNAIETSHPLPPYFPFAFNLSQYQASGLHELIRQILKLESGKIMKIDN